MTWGRLGSSPFADLSSDENVMLKDYVKAQWSLTGDLALYDPDAVTPDTSGTKVKLGTGWKRINHLYEIHFLKTTRPPPAKASTDNRIEEHLVAIDIHVFAKRNVEAEEPAELGQIMRELRRIIGAGRKLASGMPMYAGAERRADDPLDIGPVSYWHRIQEASVKYWMATTT